MLNIAIADRLKAALLKSEYWTPKTKDNGKTLFPLKCPECGKVEAWAHSKEPWSINCNRFNQCGVNTKTRELFPDVFVNIEKEFKPTAENPHRPAEIYLKSRALSKSLAGLHFEYWPNVRRTGGGAVMFPVDANKETWNGRLFSPPPGEGKTHNKGSTSGIFWKHPGLNYDPAKETFVVEAIIDALSLFEMGFQAVAVLSAGQDPAGLDFSEFKQVTLAFDNDPAGHRALKKWMGHYAESAGQMKVSALLPISGDWNDLLTAKGMNEAGKFFNDNRRRFEFEARLALAESAAAYADIYHDYLNIPPGLFAFGGSYYYASMGRKKDEQLFVSRVSNFTLDVKHYQLNTVNPEEPIFKYHLTAKPQKGRSIDFTVSAPDLSSSNSLTTTFLSRAKCLWEGDGMASKALARKIVESKAPTVRQLQTVGLDEESGCYVFKHFMVNAKGNTVFPDKNGFFCLNRSSYIRPAQYTNTLKPEGGTPMKHIYELILKAWGERGAVSVAWMVASWFVSDIKARLGFFPFLSFRGDTQCGKSCLARILNACQAIDEEGLPMRKVNTGKGEIRKLAQRSALFQALLEGNDGENARLDYDNILTWYNDTPLQIRALKTNDIQTQEIPFRSALLFVQNKEPFKTKAQRERVISLEFSKDGQTDITSKAFDALMKIRPSKLAAFFPHLMQYRVNINNDWHTFYKQADGSLSDGVNDARIQDNHALILAFHKIICNKLSVNYDLFPYVKGIAINKHRECTHKASDLADYLLDEIMRLYQHNVDKNATIIDYREMDRELWFYLPGVVAEFDSRGLSIKDVQAALKEHPAYKDSNKTHRFISGAMTATKKAWVFDTRKLSPAPIDADANANMDDAYPY